MNLINKRSVGFFLEILHYYHMPIQEGEVYYTEEKRENRKVEPKNNSALYNISVEIVTFFSQSQQEISVWIPRH